MGRGYMGADGWVGPAMNGDHYGGRYVWMWQHHQVM